MYNSQRVRTSDKSKALPREFSGHASLALVKELSSLGTRKSPFPCFSGINMEKRRVLLSNLCC